MNFELTHDQELLYASSLKYGDSMRLSSTPETLESYRDRLKEIGKFGLLGLCIPKQFGGTGYGALETALALEAFSQGSRDTGLAFAVSAHLLACARPIADFCSPEITHALLPQLCSGEKIGANATTEPEAGSDTSIMKTTAVLVGDDYILNGLKVFVTNGPIADYFIVYAATDRSKGYQGVSAILVERNTPGLRVGKNLEKLGPVHSTIAELHFTDCKVPAIQLLGKEGDGGALFKSAMTWERACLFAIYIGQMQQELDQVVEHAKNRRQFHRNIGRNQAISHRIADMKIRLESARLLLYSACWKFDQGQDSTAEISMAKVAVSEAAIQSSLSAIQIFGGTGVMSESRIENGLRNSVPSAIFSGTSELQRELIVRSLGL